jgi:hypothetical protein
MMIAAALVAWLGASLVVLADGRRGLALGLAMVAIGLAVLEWGTGQTLGALAVAAGGMIGSFQCWRSGSAAWGIMPAGSTPRLVQCIAGGLLALWVSASVTVGSGAPLRFAVLVVPGLMAARVLAARDAAVVLTAIACFALALAVAPSVGTTSPGPVPEIVGGLIAAGVIFMPGARPAGREQSALQHDQRGN